MMTYMRFRWSRIKNIIKKVVTTDPTPGGGTAGTEVIDDWDNIIWDDDGL